MAEIRFTIDDAAVQAALNRTESSLRSLRPAMKQIGEYMVGETDERFRTETDPDGNPWKPISRKWRDQKQRRGYITKVLQMRGRLRGSIAYKAEPNQVAIGTNVVYGAMHQFGGSITRYARSQLKPTKTGRKVTFQGGSTKIDARPFLGLNPDNQREVGRIVAAYIQQNWEQ